MKLGVLFSGGKDSCLALKRAMDSENEVVVLLNVFSKNKESFMFHTPSASRVKAQAEVIGLPLVVVETEGEQEKELDDLERGIVKMIEEYEIEGVVTGAVESVYQASRVQRICNKLGIECFNPLWQKDQIEILEDLIKDKFEVIVVGVFAYPLDSTWLGRKIDLKFVEEMKKLKEKFEVNPAGEGGEYESFVLGAPFFQKKLEVLGHEDFGEGYSWRREIEI